LFASGIDTVVCQKIRVCNLKTDGNKNIHVIVQQKPIEQHTEKTFLFLMGIFGHKD